MNNEGFDISVSSDRTSYSLDDALAYLLVEARPCFAESADFFDKPPVDIVMVLDVSGSMNKPERYPLLRQAVKVLIESLSETDRLCVVLFSHASEVLVPLTDAVVMRARCGSMLASMDRSPVKFGDRTLMAPALVRAFEELSQNSKPDAVRRIYCLTDGELHDADSCKKVLIGAQKMMVETHIYGFGGAFDVTQLTSMVAVVPRSVVKPLVETEQVIGTFQHLAMTAADVAVSGLQAEVVFGADVVCGDVFQYRPAERLVGPVRGGSIKFDFGAAERSRVYALLLEVRLPIFAGGVEDSRTHVGNISLSYRWGASGQRRSEVASLDVERSRVDGSDDARVSMVRDLLIGLRDAALPAQIARCEAQVVLYRAEHRDPALIAAIQRHLQSLRNPETLRPPPPPTDRLYLESSPASSRAPVLGQLISSSPPPPLSHRADLELSPDSSRGPLTLPAPRRSRPSIPVPPAGRKRRKRK